MTTVQTPPADPATPTRPPGRLGRVAPWLGAVASGAALLLAFPPYGLSLLALVGVALLAVVVHRRRVRRGALLGLVAGLVFFVPVLSWSGLNVGPVPWLLLALSQAAFLAALGAAAALCSPLVDRYRWLWPVVTGALWTGQEAVRDRAPFGGFPWARLAFSQADSPLLRYAALGGAPLVTFAVALAGGLLAVGLWRSLDIRPPRAGAPRPAGRVPRGAVRRALARIPMLGRTLGALAVFALALLVPLGRPDGPAVTVAIIQGDVPRLGLDFNAQRRAVLDNHVRATLQLAQQVAAGTAPRPDLVVWPENASDIDPLVAYNADATAEINQAATAIGAPILVGAVLEGPGRHARNAGIVWNPGTGPGPMYIKQHPVPFAEYIPLRPLARLVSSKVDMVSSDFVPGHSPGVLPAGAATLGDVICFEVAYDNIVRDTVTGGAQLLTVQTNNADFDTTEALQQLAMVRLRAVEHGRDAMMASTVGVSAFVTADGGVFDATAFNRPAVLVRRLHLGNHRTLATRLGPVPEFGLSAFAVGALLGAGLLRVRRRTPAPTKIQEDQ